MKENIDCERTQYTNRRRNEQKCMTCGSHKVSRSDFDDEISYEEYLLSRMCQDCQDEAFTDY